MAEITNDSAGFKKTTKDVQDAILTDLTMLKAAFDASIAKLNLDAGVTDADYAASGALTLTSS